MLNQDVPLPSGLQHEQFVATPLTAATAALDYAAYLASPEIIRVHSDGRWPLEGFTLAEDLELIAKHEADHEQRRAFTFVLLSPSRTEGLGCVYVNPLQVYLRRVGADPKVMDRLPSSSAMVTFWLRQDLHDTGLTDVVVEAIHEWLLSEWPLTTHIFRVLPEERSSRRALDRLDLRIIELDLPGEPRPYIWYHASV